MIDAREQQYDTTDSSLHGTIESRLQHTTDLTKIIETKGVRCRYTLNRTKLRSRQRGVIISANPPPCDAEVCIFLLHLQSLPGSRTGPGSFSSSFEPARLHETIPANLVATDTAHPNTTDSR